MRTALVLIVLTVSNSFGFGYLPIRYAETFERSEVVAIVRASSTEVLEPKDSPEPLSVSQQGSIQWLRTTLTVLAVMKGEKIPSRITLLHKRSKPGILSDGDGFATFERPEDKPTFLVFLRRNVRNGNDFLPTTGQTFAFQSIIYLENGGRIGD